MTFLKRQTKTGQASERVAAGTDELDFEAVFQQHWNRVCGVLFRLVGDWAEAEDLALDVFWRLHQRPPRLQRELPGSGEHSLRGWLYRVATNLGFNALRARKRRRRYEEEAGYQVNSDDPSWDPAVEIERKQERERVRAVLAQIKPRSAQLLILRQSGLSYAELAAALEVAPTSVGSLLARAEREFERRYTAFED